MYKAMTIKQARYAMDLDAFINTGMFNTPEIQARREERRRRDREWKAAQDRQKARMAVCREAMGKRERELEAVRQEKEAGFGAQVAGGFTMAAGLLGIAMIL